jgi:hypothetical protein
MKSIKLISLALTMLNNYVSFSQEKTLSIKISDSIINYKIDADFNILKLKEDKTLNISDDALFVVDGLTYSDDNIKNLNIEEIIIKGSQGSASFCHGNEKNNIIIINKIGFKKEHQKKLKTRKRKGYNSITK